MTAQYPDLKEKTFLVTGASSGIGRAVALALADQGAYVVATGRNEERLQATCQEAGNHCSQLACDLTDATQRNTLVTNLPQLDGVCHAAGIIDPFPIRYLDEARFDKLFDINAKAPILLTSRLLGKKKLNARASLVFVSSISAGLAMKGGSLYSASKAALEAFSKNVTLEHAQKHIRSNCLKPGMVKTAIYDQAKQFADNSGGDELYRQYRAQYPLGFGAPEQVAESAVFLLSDSSAWISSSGLVMDGGYSAQI